MARFQEVHAKFEELGLESPFDDEWRKRWEDRPADIITTSVDISEFADVRREALLAHATQVDPKSPFWFGLPPEVMGSIHPFDDYRLARTAPPAGAAGSRGPTGRRAPASGPRRISSPASPDWPPPDRFTATFAVTNAG